MSKWATRWGLSTNQSSFPARSVFFFCLVGIYFIYFHMPPYDAENPPNVETVYPLFRCQRRVMKLLHRSRRIPTRLSGENNNNHPGDSWYIFLSLGLILALNGEGKGLFRGLPKCCKPHWTGVPGVRKKLTKSREVRHRTVDSFLQPVDQFQGGGLKWSNLTKKNQMGWNHQPDLFYLKKLILNHLSVVYISDFDDASSHPKTYHRPVTAHRGENWMLQDILPDATISGNARWFGPLVQSMNYNM